MPRRFALGLVALLVFLLAGLVAARRLLMRPARGSAPAPTPTARPTPIAPPTPIASQRVSLFFPDANGDRLRAESREIPSTPDEIAFLRALASAVLDGPRRPELLPAFPEGWALRGAYRLRDGLVVLDLAPPAAAAPAEGPPAPEALLAPRWQTGAHEELAAVQALLVTLAKNAADVGKVALVVGGEPAETLAGHVDLTHPLVPDLSWASDEPPLMPPAPPTPEPVPGASPVAPAPAPSAAPTPPAAAPASPSPEKTRPAARTDLT